MDGREVLRGIKRANVASIRSDVRSLRCSCSLRMAAAVNGFVKEAISNRLSGVLRIFRRRSA